MHPVACSGLRQWLTNHAFPNLLTECLFLSPVIRSLVATAVESLVSTLRSIASKEYSNVTSGAEDADLPNDYESMRFEREVELRKVEVGDGIRLVVF
jgi:hypothetical protein